MYIFELIFKNLKNKKTAAKPHPIPPAQAEYQEQELEEDCEHVFMPIDSTKTILACNKCGFVINKTPHVKPKNPFI